MIYHLTEKANWEKAQAIGEFTVESLFTEGFIHASEQHQVNGVLQCYYSGKNNLVLLHIDETLLTSKLVYELSASINEEFPHIFGPINLDAVVQVETIDS
jgi:uncharacterized protein (DUF952 family)